MTSPLATTLPAPSPEELVEYLLAETDQREPQPTRLEPLLELLSLRSVSFSFAATLPEARTTTGETVRALLDYQERLIAVDASLDPRRSRFSSLHEIGHYVLPDHYGQIVLCSDRDLGFRAARAEEREANAFAAELQFKGRRFRLETASLPLTSATVKATAAVFDASFESTARHLVETSLKPCLLAVYEDRSQSDGGTRRTSVRYSIASASFAQRFGRRLTDEDNVHVAAAWIPGRDIADSIVDDVTVETGGGETTTFRAEYFFNGHNAFCLLTAPRS
jgi:Zn-dependent peptidase ImmA (M78 family)